MNNTEKTNKKLNYIYGINFLLAFGIALPAYINSTFLEKYTSEETVGLVYTAASILTLLILANISKILRIFTNYKTIILLLLLQIILLSTIATSNISFLILPIFVLYLTVIPILRFNLDIFLESYSSNNSTGKIRGMFLTSANFAWVLAPAIAGSILTNGDYWKIYGIAAIFIFPIILLVRANLKNFKDPQYDKVPFWNTLKQIWKNKNIYKIFMANLVLWFFYSWMVIYMPIYLYQYIGFNWGQLGVMFTIMLLPFIIFQIPAGNLADIKWGEKEFLSVGFIIMAIASGIIAFIASTSFFVWASILFVTRIGASIVEIMTESYFFKQIDGTDANVIGMFRNTRAIAYIIAPIIASVFLYTFAYQYIFLVLGVVMLFGLKYSLTLKDTK